MEWKEMGEISPWNGKKWVIGLEPDVLKHKRQMMRESVETSMIFKGVIRF